MSAETNPAEPNATHCEKKPVTKRRKSLAQVRGFIDDARRWYVQGLIPAEGSRVEVRQPSLQDVSVASGTAYRTLERRSKGEGWVAQREAFARKALDIENTRLLQAMADQHARARTAYFRSSMRLQRVVEEKLAQGGEGYDMQDLSAAGSALAKAQGVTDIAILGAKVLQGPVAQANLQVNVGWPQVAGPPSTSLQATLTNLDEVTPADAP